MNAVLSNIYGTGGFEKTAGAEQLPDTLNDLAIHLTVESGQDGSDMQKTASVHRDILETLTSFDEAGRYGAQAEFSEMEKAASEGNPEALQEFFADVGEATELDERAHLREQLVAELRRRGM